MKQAIPFLILLAAATVCFAEVKYDQYGGAQSVQGKAKGVFSVAKFNDRWWLLTPDGNGFISMGVVHILQGTSQPVFKAKYGGSEAGHGYVDDAAKNLKAWGFNTGGYQSTTKTNLEMAKYLPFVVSMEILATSRWQAEKFHYDDVFDPVWQRKTAKEIEQVCQPVRDQKNLIGYCITDIPSWTLRKADGHPDWMGYYRSLPADAAGKQRYVAYLVERLGSVQAIASRYGVTAASEKDLQAVTEWPIDAADATILADDEAFVVLIAKEYYRLCHTAIRQSDPNHLFFGDRYCDIDVPEPVLRAALPYLDALAIQPTGHKFNRDRFDRIYKIADKPILICDWAYSFSTPEHPKTMWVSFNTEDEAADAYEAYLNDAFAAPYMLGVHRCQYIDRPRPGTLKQGLIREDGTPYETTVKRYTEIHRKLYERMYTKQFAPTSGPTKE